MSDSLKTGVANRIIDIFDINSIVSTLPNKNESYLSDNQLNCLIDLMKKQVQWMCLRDDNFYKSFGGAFYQ